VAVVYLGLGSNLGDRLANLRAAHCALDSTANVAVVAASHVYETAPVGPVQQGAFFNQVLEVRTELQPRELLRELKDLERRLGREASPRWGPRVIDLDILLYDSVDVESESLTIPHADMWRRLFVLAPLAELKPELRSPAGVPIADVIAALRSSQTAEPYISGRPEPAAARLPGPPPY
jgi:2-amino-4-hydroxy-6-hydroxymethyldihydropteridine diphosphokinase